MFSLLQGFYAELTYEHERRVALLGIQSAGKSSLLEWLKVFHTTSTPPSSPAPPKSLEKITPTVGLNVAKLRVCGERLLVWDLGGAPALRTIWDRYIEEAEAVIWVVDSCDAPGLAESRAALKAVVERDRLRASPLLVYANKQEEGGGGIDPVRVSLELGLVEHVGGRAQCVQPCSAQTGEGVREGVEWLMRHLQGKETKLEMRIP